MHLLLVNLYEFGLFLRILLWISVPLIVVALLVTTWLHYRSRRKADKELVFSMEGMDITADPADLLAAIQGRVMPMLAEGAVGAAGEGGVEGAAREGGVEGSPAEGGASNEDASEQESFSERERNRMYKGILWMKEKYEQYRDLADQRIEQLKDELIRSERRYQDLLDQRAEGRVPGKAEQPAPDRVEQPAPEVIAHHSPEAAEQPSLKVVDDRERLLAEKGRQLEEKDHQLESKDHLLKDKDQLLESKDREIKELQSQLKAQWLQTEGLVSKLQNSSQLLLKISRELDGSLPAGQPQPDPQAQAEAQPS